MGLESGYKHTCPGELVKLPTGQIGLIIEIRNDPIVGFQNDNSIYVTWLNGEEMFLIREAFEKIDLNVNAYKRR